MDVEALMGAVLARATRNRLQRVGDNCRAEEVTRILIECRPADEALAHGFRAQRRFRGVMT